MHFKKYMLHCLLAAFLTILHTGDGHAQKMDVEKKIARSEFPTAALHWLDQAFPNPTQMRYFIEMESGSDTVNYEAKFCWQKERYSIVFFEDGELYEVEKEIGFEVLHPSTQANIKRLLDTSYKKWKIARLQERTLPPAPEITYELLVTGRDATGAAMHNFYFTKSGEMLEKSKIVLPSKMINQY